MQTRSVVQNALYQWLTGATGLPVDWVRQGGSRPADASGNMVPHCTLCLTSVVTPGPVAERHLVWDPVSNVFIETTRITKRVNVQAEAYTTEVQGDNCATAVLDKGLDRLMTVPVRDSLIAVGLGLFETTPVLDLSELLTTKFQGRAQFSMSFHAISELSNPIDWIAEFSGTGTISPGNVSIPFDVEEG